jgi:hypothetical protein
MATFFEDESAVLENASMMVDACRQEYERVGMDEEASSLFGLEVHTYTSARLALLTVSSLPATAETADVRRCTIDAVAAAVRFCSPSHIAV